MSSQPAQPKTNRHAGNAPTHRDEPGNVTNENSGKRAGENHQEDEDDDSDTARRGQSNNGAEAKKTQLPPPLLPTAKQAANKKTQTPKTGRVRPRASHTTKMLRNVTVIIPMKTATVRIATKNPTMLAKARDTSRIMATHAAAAVMKNSKIKTET